MKKLDFLICSFILVSSCNHKDRIFKTPHFTFYYTKLDDTSMNYISGRMVTPNDPKQDYQNMIRNLIHEFAHCASMKINPTIGNNPRWLWESVAIYEGNYPWDPHMLPYLVNQEAPPLDTLNTMTNTMIYQVGYFIAQYINETFGKSVLKELIQNNGDLNSSLHIDGEEFRRKWFEFVKKKYGI